MPLSLLVSLIFALGILNGLRTLTPAAVLCWGAHLGWYSLAHTPFFFLSHPISVFVFSLLAVGEWIGDKLPKTPARTEPFPLAARMFFAAACGGVLATLGGVTNGPVGSSHGNQSAFIVGILAGGLGAFLGTYGGFLIRRMLTGQAGLPDLPVALAEDALTVGGALFVVSRF